MSSRPPPAKDSLIPRPDPMWFGDHLALDFLNTTAVLRGQTVEWLRDGDDWIGWLCAAGALPAAAGKRLRAQAEASALDDCVRDAIHLRDWFRGLLVRLKTDGGGATEADLAPLNVVLASAPLFRRIDTPRDSPPRLIAEQAWRHAGDTLAPVAAAMADLICESDLDLVRTCENPQCTMWFLDRTKGHRRRWCSQAICGNRAKVAAFRARRKA